MTENAVIAIVTGIVLVKAIEHGVMLWFRWGKDGGMEGAIVPPEKPRRKRR